MLHPGDAIPHARRIVYVILLGALTALGPFTIDLTCRRCPTLQTEFDVSTAAIQLTLTATTIGFAVGQLLVGPLADKVGRRMPLMVATAVHIVACLSAALAPNVELLGVARTLQGIGAAAGGVVAMAMVRDLFGGRPLVRMLSRLALVNGLAPVLAPVLGSTLLLVMPWRGIFVVLAAYGLFVLVCVALWIVETLPKARRHDAGHATVGQRYRSVLSDRVFVGIAIVGAANFTGLFSYLSSSSLHLPGDLSLQRPAVRSPVRRQLDRHHHRGAVVRTAHQVRRAAVDPRLFDRRDVPRLGADRRARPGARRTLGDRHPALVLHRRVRLRLPVRPGARAQRHGQGRDGGSPARRANFGTAGIVSPIVGWLAKDSAARRPDGGVSWRSAPSSRPSLWLVVRPRCVPAGALTIRHGLSRKSRTTRPESRS